jgi:hypothetical protein
MTELRTFIDLLRADLGVPYPLAHHRPFVSGRNLVMRAQDRAGLDPDFCLVAVAGGQLILTAHRRLRGPGHLVRRHRHRLATPRRPQLTRSNESGRPVRQPAIGGISTDVLAGLRID